MMPLPRESISGSTARVHRNVPRRCTAIIWSKSSTVRSTNRFCCRNPALFTRISGGPQAACTASMIRRTDSGSETSPGAAAASPPDSFIRATTSSAVSPFRSLTTTRSPFRASFSAMARPIPLPAPVTRTARERSGVIGALLSLAHDYDGASRTGSPRLPFLLAARITSRSGRPFHHLGLARVLHVAGTQHEEPGDDRREPAAQERGEHHVLSGQEEEAAEQRPSSDRSDRAHGVDERGPCAAHPGRERLAHEEQQGSVGSDYEE